jgi:hypothetical protein
MLSRKTTTNEDIQRLIENLINLAQAKSYLSQIAFAVLITLFEQVRKYPRL